MNGPLDEDLAALHRSALDATRGWSSAKASMALRAAGLDSAEGGRVSLDAIAADSGVSRETVRRARNELLHTMEFLTGTTGNLVYSSSLMPAPVEPSVDSPATARALRRLLTMTGPLPWDEVLSAWARAGGRPPYSPLPTDVASMRTWVNNVVGLTVNPGSDAGASTIAVVLPEQLDQVSQFLRNELRERPGGLDRNVLLERAVEAGLKPTTIATALSIHPAVTRICRGVWALRGRRPSAFTDPARVNEPLRAKRVRPTTFAWGHDGTLQIEFSVPRGPSPVVAVPKAVSEIVEGRTFGVDAGEKPMRIAVRNARLWGFGPPLSKLGLPSGGRATIALNLLAGTATIAPADRKGRTR